MSYVALKLHLADYPQWTTKKVFICTFIYMS